MEISNESFFSEYSKEIRCGQKIELENILNKIEKKNNLNFQCQKCFGTFRIAHIHNDESIIYLDCDCLCLRKENIQIDYIEDYFKYTEQKKYKGIKIYDNSICNYHNSKFTFFCKDCQKDICSNCIEEIHVNHGLIDLNGENITKVIQSIKEKINNYQKSNENNNNNFSKIIKLLKHLILVYENFPCYNINYSIVAVNYFLLGNKKR